jgi:hypothetical protein
MVRFLTRKRGKGEKGEKKGKQDIPLQIMSEFLKEKGGEEERDEGGGVEGGGGGCRVIFHFVRQ